MGSRLSPQFNWTNEQVERFKALCSQLPALSYAEIAAKMGGGLSRNACIGKALRLGLKKAGGLRSGNPRPLNPSLARFRRAPQQSRGNYIAGKVKRTYSRKTTTPTLLELFEVSDMQINDLPTDQSQFAVKLLDAQEHHCRWPLGEPSSPDFMFCGDTRIPERPYCLRHCVVAYMPSRPRPVYIPVRRVA